MATFSEELNAALKEAAEENNNNGVELDAAIERIASAIAEEVKEQIERAVITIPAGAVQVAGSATSQANASDIVIAGGIALADG